MTAGPDAITFAQTWMRSVERGPSSQFLVFEAPDGTTISWTYAEFDELVGRCAALLNELHVRAGSAVSIALTNSPAFVAIWIATVRLGAWLVPSDPMAAVPELAEHIARTRPVIGFCAITRADTYRAAAADAHMHLVEVDEADSTLAMFGEAVFGETACAETVVGKSVCPPGDLAGWPTPALTDRAAVMFTTGPTGVPDGVEITQADYAFAGATMAAASGLQPDDRQLVVLPLFRATAQFRSLASAIWVGASVVLARKSTAFSTPRCVIGHSDAIRDEVPVASVTRDPMSPPDLAALDLWREERLTKATRQRNVALVAQPPRPNVGTIRSFMLRDVGAESRVPR